jgi:hypothetical protein
MKETNHNIPLHNTEAPFTLSISKRLYLYPAFEHGLSLVKPPDSNPLDAIMTRLRILAFDI